MQFLIILVVLTLVVIVVTAPLRAQQAHEKQPYEEEDGARGQLADLEAAREAKYREIRDAELDHRTGKLSDADFEAVDRSLRAEAIEIMHGLDRVGDAPATDEQAGDPDRRAATPGDPDRRAANRSAAGSE